MAMTAILSELQSNIPHFIVIEFFYEFNKASSRQCYYKYRSDAGLIIFFFSEFCATSIKIDDIKTKNTGYYGRLELIQKSDDDDD